MPEEGGRDPAPGGPVPRLELAPPVAGAVWTHLRRAAPQEGVGALAGRVEAGVWVAERAYPLPNIAARPETEYLGDPGAAMRAFREMRGAGLSLVGLYHSHPRGPARPSPSDRAQAAYEVPYLIADLRRGEWRAYLLPGGGKEGEEIGVWPAGEGEA